MAVLTIHEKAALVADYARRFPFGTAIETGLYHGHGTIEKLPEDVCPRRLVVDIDEQNCQTAAGLGQYSRVFEGDSGEMMPTVLTGVDEPALFWLDAHRNEEYDGRHERMAPLLDELAAIRAWPHAPWSVVLIDDARLFAEPGFPTIAEIEAACNNTWHWQEADDVIRLTPKIGTSLTDRPDWRRFCTLAGNDLSLLDRDPDGVLADVVGERSMREARYERVVGELVDRFGSLSRWPILEIGGGYGGLALAAYRRFPAASWYIRDLAEPRWLQESFLRHHGGYRMPAWEPTWAGLAVSCYAISECRRDTQLRLLRLMARAPRGYIRWNGWVTGQVKLGEVLAAIPGAHAEPCAEDERNRVITWRDQ